MKGFDAEFLNLDHYIRVITERIWEGGRIDDILTYYSDPCIVETPSSVTTELDAVVQGTRATLAMFPDRRLLAEDVIQSGDEDHGFLSSHRIISTMTHCGDGAFGPATRKVVHVRTIADCLCKNNRIVHEWLVRDQGAIARQIGMTPQDLAQAWLNQRGGWHKPVADKAPGAYISHIATDAGATDYAAAVKSMAGGSTNALAIYDEAVHHLGPGEITRYGRKEVGAFWCELFAALEVSSFEVEHLALNTGDGRSDRIAMRWRAQTRHTNGGKPDGVFGSPTGRSVEVLGINHVEIVNGRVVREWALVDELALWMQILTAKV